MEKEKWSIVKCDICKKNNATGIMVEGNKTRYICNECDIKQMGKINNTEKRENENITMEKMTTDKGYTIFNGDCKICKMWPCKHVSNVYDPSDLWEKLNEQ